MFNKQSLAVLIFTSILGGSAANAQIAKCYTLQSIQGNYAILGNYGANVAIALGVRNYDGNGNVTGTFTLNEPTAGSSTGARTIVTGTNVGTYTVNCNGTGKITRVLSTSNGITSVGVDDFVITAAVVIGGQLIATTIVDAQQTPSAIVAGGIFLTRVHTRLPDYYN
jgi:hypothetical protein